MNSSILCEASLSGGLCLILVFRETPIYMLDSCVRLKQEAEEYL